MQITHRKKGRLFGILFRSRWLNQWPGLKKKADEIQRIRVDFFSLFSPCKANRFLAMNVNFVPSITKIKLVVVVNRWRKLLIIEIFILFQKN